MVVRGIGKGRGELEEGSPRVQTSSYKINKYWGYNVRRDDHPSNTVERYTGKLLKE